MQTLFWVQSVHYKIEKIAFLHDPIVLLDWKLRMKLHQIPGEVSWHVRQFFAKSLPAHRCAGVKRQLEQVLFFNLEGSTSGSTYLRQTQLADVFSKVIETKVIDDLRAVEQNALVVGAKGTFELLSAARESGVGNGVVFLYDPVDELINPRYFSGRIDGVIASSYHQYHALLRAARCPVYSMLHHVDFRIPRQRQTINRARVGYFGAFGNVFMTPEISERVDIIEATQPADSRWFSRLDQYAFHYCVRRKREKSHSYKPSTKIYLAACVGAAVIITRDESDAEFILPPDYPFFSDSRSEKSVLELLEYARVSFGTPIYERARNQVAFLRGWDYSDQLDQAKYLLELVSSSSWR